MDTSSQLETSEAGWNPSRDSYSSNESHSARNSYSSISGGSIASSRTSYSSIPDLGIGRISSFSRTAEIYEPGSDESTPVASRESSPNSPSQWKTDGVAMADHISSSELNKRARSYSKSGSKDGPSALKDLENVRNVICVAFGAFDRYYISWEDNEGDFHQESHKLPESLYQWLFPPSGETRHLPSLQVSFGSNDDFFASDQFGKLSSRDANPPLERKAPPKLADVAKGILGAGFMRRKAYTVSSPTATQPMTVVDDRPISPRMERRKTLLDGQSSPRPEVQLMPTVRESSHARRDSSSDPDHGNRRRSILSIGQFTRLESRSEVAKVEPKVAEEPNPARLDLDEAHRRRSILPVGQFTRLEPRSESPKAEQALLLDQTNVQDSQPESPRGERTRSRSPIKERDQQPVSRSEQFQPSHNRRRSILAGVPPVRPSWPDRRTVFQNKEPIQLLGAQRPIQPPQSRYVDACVQTEFEESPILVPVVPANLPPQHAVPIGSFSDFFRGSYSLGDGLRLI